VIYICLKEGFEKMEWLKIIHMTCAFLAISGFVLRTYWMMTDSSFMQHVLTKRLPHVNDSLLLIAAIILAYDYGLNPFEHSWLLAKIIALLFYIGFGLVAFRFGKNKTQKVVASFLAMLCFAYIVQTAITKNPWVF
jgi:uncharacterized membrane protein SirB2